MSKNLLSKLEAKLNTGELFEIVDNSLAASQVLYALGYAKKGQYISIVKQYLIDNDIDTSHFTSNGKPALKLIKKVCPVCASAFTTEYRCEGEQVTCSRACSNTYFRTKSEGSQSSYRKRALDHYGTICSVCGYSNSAALEVHHKDENRSNNHISNLVVLCANCHRLTHS